MSSYEITDLIRCVSVNNGADKELISRVEDKLGFQFRDDYKLVLEQMNGFEGFVGGDQYVIFWPADQLLELNDSYNTQEFAPGLFLIGTNGADAGYGFDLRDPLLPVVEVPLVGMCLSQVKQRGRTLFDFFQNLAASPS